MIAHTTAIVNANPLAPSLDSIAFARDALHGWAGGDGTIIATSDAGESWQTVWTGDRTVGEIRVLDAAHIWAVGAKEDKGGRTIAMSLLRTSDGGLHWSASALDRRIHSLDFVSRTLGWAIKQVGSTDTCGVACGVSGELVRTVDGGRTWHRAGITGIGAICFKNADVGYVAGRHVLATIDGGRTWQRRAAIGPGDFGGPTALDCSGSALWLFVDLGGGAGGHVNYAAYRSVDDGRHLTLALGNTFYPDTPRGLPTADAEPGPFVAPRDSTAVELGTSPAAEETSITVTHDGGRHWFSVSLEDVPTIGGSIAFPDARNGWVVVDIWNHGEILATADGGRSWREVYPTNSPSPEADISFVSPIVGFGLGVPGDSRAILTTADGGESWVAVGDLPKDAAPAAGGGSAGGPQLLSFADAKVGWAVSPHGNLFATADGGRSWRQVAVPPATSFVNGVALADPTHGCMLTYDPQTSSNSFLQTSDGGLTWAVVSADQSLSACARGAFAARVAAAARADVSAYVSPGPFFAGDEAWAMVETGLAHTSDAGATWTVIDWPAPTDPSAPPVGPVDMSFVDASNGWMLTYDRVIYRTQDGGNSWSSLGDGSVPGLMVDHPTVTVTPSTNLHGGQTVSVNVTGFGVGGKVFLSECSSAAVATDLGCGRDLAGQIFLVTDDSRAGESSFVVTADAAVGQLSAVHARCTDHCVIVATIGAGYAFVVAPISFKSP